MRNNLTDACEKNDPCQHGGICISTDSGPLCECRNLDYEGTYCERGKCNYKLFLTIPTLLSHKHEWIFVQTQVIFVQRLNPKIMQRLCYRWIECERLNICRSLQILKTYINTHFLNKDVFVLSEKSFVSSYCFLVGNKIWSSNNQIGLAPLLTTVYEFKKIM